MEILRVYKLYHKEKYCIALQYAYQAGNAIDKKVRALPGRKYSSTRKCWYIPYRDDYKTYLAKEFAAFDELSIVFPPDHEDVPAKAQNSTESIPAIKSYLLIDKNKQKYFLKHDYHPALFKKIMQSGLGFWNKKKKVWIFQGSDAFYNKITKILQSENCNIEKTEVKQPKDHPSPVNKEKKVDVTLDEAGRDVLKVFNHTMQIRRLSERTQDVYRPFFKEFLAAFPGEDIRTFTYGKIYDYVKKRQRIWDIPKKSK